MSATVPQQSIGLRPNLCWKLCVTRTDHVVATNTVQRYAHVSVVKGIFQLTAWDIRARFRPTKHVEHLISTEGTEAKTQNGTLLSDVYRAKCRPDWYKVPAKRLLQWTRLIAYFWLIGYWKLKGNILCSTRFSVVERVRMSHAVNWKMPSKTGSDARSALLKRHFI